MTEYSVTEDIPFEIKRQVISVLEAKAEVSYDKVAIEQGYTTLEELSKKAKEYLCKRIEGTIKVIDKEDVYSPYKRVLLAKFYLPYVESEKIKAIQKEKEVVQQYADYVEQKLRVYEKASLLTLLKLWWERRKKRG